MRGAEGLEAAAADEQGAAILAAEQGSAESARGAAVATRIEQWNEPPVEFTVFCITSEFFFCFSAFAETPRLRAKLSYKTDSGISIRVMLRSEYFRAI